MTRLTPANYPKLPSIVIDDARAFFMGSLARELGAAVRNMARRALLGVTSPR